MSKTLLGKLLSFVGIDPTPLASVRMRSVGHWLPATYIKESNSRLDKEYLDSVKEDRGI